MAHCANSNFSLDSGIMDVRLFLNEGLKLGLGTDVAGGYSASILNAMREALIASKSLAFQQPAAAATDVGGASSSAVSSQSYVPLTHEEAFYLATLGGAHAVGLGARVGNFEVGKEFDAQLIDPCPKTGELPPFDVFDADSAADVFMKWLFIGDDRNIADIYVACVAHTCSLLEIRLYVSYSYFSPAASACAVTRCPQTFRRFGISVPSPVIRLQY